jgi:hypothetical protein
LENELQTSILSASEDETSRLGKSLVSASCVSA